MGSSFSIASGLTILIGIPVLLLLLREIWLVVTPGPNVTMEPSCGNCRYSVAGLTTMTCPECAADLRVVGILSPASQARKRGNLAWALVAWSIIGGLITLAAYDYAAKKRLMEQRIARVASTVKTQTKSIRLIAPTSQTYGGVNLAFEETLGSHGATLSIELQARRALSLALERNVNGTWILKSEIGTQALPPGTDTASAVGALFKVAQIPVDPATQRELDHVAAVGDRFLSGSPGVSMLAGPFRGISSFSTNSNTPGPIPSLAYYPVLALGASGALWLGVGTLITWRRRALRAFVLSSPRLLPYAAEPDSEELSSPTCPPTPPPLPASPTPPLPASS